MNISITARKFKALDTLKEFINAEVQSLEKFYDEIMKAEVVLSFQHNQNSIKVAEVLLTVPGQVLKATDETDDFKKSVSSCVEKLGRQLDKLKTKKNARIVINDQDRPESDIA
jgi:ribosomal subunit interface protein